MQIIHTDKAPAAIGPYSQAIVAGGFLFTSGQIPVDPATGAFAGDTIELQTHQSLKNLKAILEGKKVPYQKEVNKPYKPVGEPVTY